MTDDVLPAEPLPFEVRPVTDAEFALFCALIAREAGILLGPQKKVFLMARLGRRVRALGFSSYGAYLRKAVRVDATERQRMLELVCTHETAFFREPQQFDWMARELVPKLRAEAAAGRRDKTVRAWSAACSTGEEPYSVALTLLEGLPIEEGWRVEVLATDLSGRVLEPAVTGIYPEQRARGIPEPLRKKYFLRGVRAKEGLVQAGPKLRSKVRFALLNLNHAPYELGHKMDLVLCRNAMIYFAPEVRARVVAGLVDAVRPGGHLLVGHAESLHGAHPELRGVRPTIYVRQERAA